MITHATITITRRALSDAIRRLATGRRVLVVPAGLSRSQGGIEFLIDRIEPERTAGAFVRLCRLTNATEWLDIRAEAARAGLSEHVATAVLGIGFDPPMRGVLRGTCVGSVPHPEVLTLRIVGFGVTPLRLADSWPLR